MVAGSSGLVRKFSAPERIASTAVSTEAKAVIITKAPGMPSSRAARTSARPSMRGMRTSARMMSMLCSRRMPSASIPSAASETV